MSNRVREIFPELRHGQVDQPPLFIVSWMKSIFFYRGQKNFFYSKFWGKAVFERKCFYVNKQDS